MKFPDPTMLFETVELEIQYCHVTILAHSHVPKHRTPNTEQAQALQNDTTSFVASTRNLCKQTHSTLRCSCLRTAVHTNT